MNRITEIKLTLQGESSWIIEVTKEFAPQYGGGSQVFTEYGGAEIHEALRRASYMVTFTPAHRADFHSFVATPEGGDCSSCGRERSHMIHNSREVSNAAQNEG
jgi:uncharacterized membrane protein